MKRSSQIRHDGERCSLVAIEEEVRFPSERGRIAARSVRILRIEQQPVFHNPHLGPSFQPSGRLGERRVPTARPRLELPQPSSEAPDQDRAHNKKCVGLRSVGEVVTDEAGHFYEVRGRQLRPLGELLRDQLGMIFEVDRTEERKDGATNAGTNAAATKLEANDPYSAVRGSKTEINVNQRSGPKPNGNSTRPSPTGTRGERQPSYRKILADPGLYLELPFARVKDEIAPQIKHAEKLKDTDLIECYGQIYEAQHTISAAQIAARELGNSALHSQLHPLTRDQAEKLGVPQLFKPIRCPFETQASTRRVYPGQRLYRLRPVFDPTIDRDTKSEGRGAAPTSVPPAVAGGSTTTAAALRTAIPQKYINPLQFRYSRQEVLYDMRGWLGTFRPEAGRLARWFLIYPLRLTKGVATVLLSRGRMKKWRAMLEGKSLDEQLWVVTPPRGFSHHPVVRGWAEQMLSRTGSNLGDGLLEWEIFWRRKGWK